VTSPAPDDRERPVRLRRHHLLALVPAVGMLAGVPLANRVAARVLGLPFLLFWILAWVLVTSACMGLLYAIDRRRVPRGPDEADRRS
jgi:Protein of unknown function (DUF3311)